MPACAGGTASVFGHAHVVCLTGLRSSHRLTKGKKKKDKKKKKKKRGATLSFAVEDVVVGSGGGEAGDAEPRPKKKVRKDPTVKTDFLPDREREEQERQLREKLKQEWKEKQDEEKSKLAVSVAPSRTACTPDFTHVTPRRTASQSPCWRSRTVIGTALAIVALSRCRRAPP